MFKSILSVSGTLCKYHFLFWKAHARSSKRFRIYFCIRAHDFAQIINTSPIRLVCGAVEAYNSHHFQLRPEDIWFAIEATEHEFANRLAGVGIGDLVDFVGVEPDFAFLASSHGGDELFLGAKVDSEGRRRN